MNDLKRLFGKAVDSAEKASITHGYLGRFLLDGSEQVEVPGQPDIVWVRVGTAETDINVTRARNVGVPLIFGLPVKMKLIDGQYRIIDIDHDRLDVGVEPPIGAINSVWGLVDTPSDPEDNQNKILIVAGTDLVFDNANNHLHDHTLLTNIGTNTHVQIDTHIADATLHFTQASIDHTLITNIGTNSHAAIDTHIADATIHFTQGSIDHGSIAGLGDDDHTQYALLAGRSGGQTLNGGTASGNNLMLNGTSHATPGAIILNANGGDVGIGGTPLALFHLQAVNPRFYYTATGGGTDQKHWGYAVGSSGASMFGFVRDDADSAGADWLQVNRSATTIDSVLFPNGNVGIGAAIPSSVLHIKGTNSSAGGFILESSAGTDAQRLAIYAQGNFSVALQKLSSNGLFRWLNSSGVDEMFIGSNGNVGFGTLQGNTAQGKIHGHDGTAGFLHVSKTGVAGTAVTVIPNGTGDILYGARINVLCRSSAGILQSVEQLFSGAGEGDIYNNGTNTEVCKLRINADGSMDVRRTAGTLTYMVAIWVHWM